jgi:hypothetical protein
VGEKPRKVKGGLIQMHLYWRIIEELKLLGETWTFTNPSLKRSYNKWLKAHAQAIMETERHISKRLLRGVYPHSLN